MNMIRASGLPSANTVVLANCFSAQPSNASSAALRSGKEAHAFAISIARPTWSLSCACGFRTDVGVTLGLRAGFVASNVAAEPDFGDLVEDEIAGRANAFT